MGTTRPINIECYIQRTLLTVPGKEVYLAEKCSNKRIELTGVSSEMKEKLASLFALVEVNFPLMPTIYERFGKDSVIVRGRCVNECETTVTVDLDIPGGGVYFA